MLYTCVYFSEKNINAFVGFTGVNGQFTSKCRPAEITPGKWRVSDQTLRMVKDKKNKVWVEVRRRVLLAPLELKWDPAKHGGIWTW